MAIEQLFNTGTNPTTNTNSNIVSSSENAVTVLNILGFDVAVPSVTYDFSDSRPYDIYLIDTQIVSDSGQVQMPATGVGSDAGISAIVKVSGGMLQMIVTWVAGRSGAPPVLPAYFTSNPNIVPLRGSIIAKEVIPSADGATLKYLVSGSYVYAILDPSQYNIVAAQPPFLSSAVAAAALQGFKYWTNVYQFSGATGANPFVEGGTTNGIIPEPIQAYQNPGNSFLGMTAPQVDVILNTTQNSTSIPNASGNGSSGSSQQSQSQNPAPGPKVNP